VPGKPSQAAAGAAVIEMRGVHGKLRAFEGTLTGRRGVPGSL
jgi:hypothetical protein